MGKEGKVKEVGESDGVDEKNSNKRRKRLDNKYFAYFSNI